MICMLLQVEYHVRAVGNHYEKIPNTAVDNWVWQSQGAINMHLPERWGYLQFSTDAVNSTKPLTDPSYPQRAALSQMYDALHQFSAVNGYFTADLTQLTTLPQWVVDGSCGTQMPNITLPDAYSFLVTVESQTSGLSVGNIRTDRLTWFGTGPVPPGQLRET